MDIAPPTTMPAWVAAAARRGEIRCVELPVPVPGPDDLLVKVRVCGVCRTDLHVRDADLPPHRERVVPGMRRSARSCRSADG